MRTKLYRKNRAFVFADRFVGLSGFTDDTGMTLPEPDLKFVDEALNLPLDERNIQWISNRISLGG